MYAAEMDAIDRLLNDAGGPTRRRLKTDMLRSEAMNCENALDAIHKSMKRQKTDVPLVQGWEVNLGKLTSNLVKGTRTSFDRCQYSETREEGWKTCEYTDWLQEKTDLWRKARAKLIGSETYCNIILQWILRKGCSHNNEVKTTIRLVN